MALAIGATTASIRWSSVCGSAATGVNDSKSAIRASNRVKRIRMIRVAGQEPRAYTKRFLTICGKRGTRDSGLGTRADCNGNQRGRSEEHTSELQSLMRISYAVFCLKKKINNSNDNRYLIQDDISNAG